MNVIKELLDSILEYSKFIGSQPPLIMVIVILSISLSTCSNIGIFKAIVIILVFYIIVGGIMIFIADKLSKDNNKM